MNTDQLPAAFHEIVALTKGSNDPTSCWFRVLEVTGQSSNKKLNSIDVPSEIDSIIGQLRSIFDAAPLPSQITFLYFGLFDLFEGGKETTRYYLSGFTGEKYEETLNQAEDPAYLPRQRYLRSAWLNMIRDESTQLGQSTRAYARRGVLEYAVTFGAAAILSRFGVESLGIALPVFLGFDSGDFARINA